MVRSGSIPRKVYKFVCNEDVFIETNLIGRTFDEEWLGISENGRITVKGSHGKGYAWDGCSPKLNFIDLVIGTPDGRLDFLTKQPITYFASMIHDALYQHKAKINLSRKEVDVIFNLNLQKSGFMLTPIYYFFVRLLGGIYGNWAAKYVQKTIVISKFSWIEENILDSDKNQSTD